MPEPTENPAPVLCDGCHQPTTEPILEALALRCGHLVHLCRGCQRGVAAGVANGDPAMIAAAGDSIMAAVRRASIMFARESHRCPGMPVSVAEPVVLDGPSPADAVLAACRSMFSPGEAERVARAAVEAMAEALAESMATEQKVAELLKRAQEPRDSHPADVRDNTDPVAQRRLQAERASLQAAYDRAMAESNETRKNTKAEVALARKDAPPPTLAELGYLRKQAEGMPDLQDAIDRVVASGMPPYQIKQAAEEALVQHGVAVEEMDIPALPYPDIHVAVSPEAIDEFLAANPPPEICPHGFARHHYDGGFAPGCDWCADEIPVSPPVVVGPLAKLVTQADLDAVTRPPAPDAVRCPECGCDEGMFHRENCSAKRARGRAAPGLLRVVGTDSTDPGIVRVGVPDAPTEDEELKVRREAAALFLRDLLAKVEAGEFVQFVGVAWGGSAGPGVFYSDLISLPEALGHLDLAHTTLTDEFFGGSGDS